MCYNFYRIKETFLRKVGIPSTFLFARGFLVHGTGANVTVWSRSLRVMHREKHSKKRCFVSSVYLDDQREE